MIDENMTSRPWVSVIVPVYNVEQYLDRCLKSLLAQTFSRVEIILVDDGSKDSSGRICDEYAEKYRQIIVVHKENGGLGSARNAGIPHARGEYITFVDSDDWIEDNTYEMLHSSIRKTTPDIISFGFRRIKNGTVVWMGFPEFPGGYYNKDQLENWILPDSIAHHRAFDQVYIPVQLSACGNLYKREFIRKQAIWFPSERVVLNEDWLFNVCCLHRAESVLVVHEAFYNYDIREGSLGMSHKTDSYERKKKLFASYWEELEETAAENPEIGLRLRNFWIEAIYNCYMIELTAPVWDRAVKKRIEKMLHDPEFIAYSRELSSENCTMKGIVFMWLTRLRLHGLMRMAYRIKKRYWR